MRGQPASELDPLLRGAYPADVLALADPFGGFPIEPGDLAAIAASLDWLGVNYYHDIVLGAAAADDLLHPGASRVGEAPPPGEPAEDPIAMLKQLGALHEQGILTDEEFAAQKAKILG